MVPVPPPRMVDVSFALQGQEIPFEHGYALYSALSNKFPALHEAAWLGVHPIYGPRQDEQRLKLTKESSLRLRIPAERLSEVTPLQGQPLSVLGNEIVPGAVRIQMLRPSSSLRCYRATIKNAVEDDAFCQSLLALLVELGVHADIEYRRVRPLQIADKKIVCFRVRLHGLSPEHSLLLQSVGVGGRRRMGCGLFDPL